MAQTLEDLVYEWLQSQYPNRYEKLPLGLYNPAHKAFQRGLMRFLLDRCKRGNVVSQTKVAAVAGMNRNTIRRWMREFGLTVQYRECDPDGHYAKYGKKRDVPATPAIRP